MQDLQALHSAAQVALLVETLGEYSTPAPSLQVAKTSSGPNRAPGPSASEIQARLDSVLSLVPGQSRDDKTLAVLQAKCVSTAEHFLGVVAAHGYQGLDDEQSLAMAREASLPLVSGFAADLISWLRGVMNDRDGPVASHIRSLAKDAQTASTVRYQELTAAEQRIHVLLGALQPVEKAKPKRRHIATSTYDSDSDSSIGESARQHRFKSKAKKRTRAANAATSAQDTQREHLSTLHALRVQVSVLCTVATLLPLELRFLRHLIYESIDAREDSIHDAASGTFSWLLDEQPQVEMRPHMGAARDLFNSWLRKGNDVFHISGNAGSGKSTLTKLVARHPRTRAELLAWAGPKTLVFSSFYFWNSGTPMQMSLQGLYRSILLEIARKCPDMIPTLVPDEWQALQSDSSGRQGSPFGPGTAEAAFKRLLAMENHPTHRFCFFIDGLDEYTVEDVDYAALALTLKTWGEKSYVKLCVSARPYPEFLSVFSSDFTLHLHKLTAHDVMAYTHRSLESTEAKAVLLPHASRIVDTVVTKSAGVFLWSRVVVPALVNQAMRGASIDTILRTLDAYPTDINELYDQMLGTLSPEDRLKSHLMLLVVARNPFAQPINALWLSWLDELRNPDFPTLGRPLSAARVQQRHNAVRADLAWLGQGLIEMFADRRERKDGDQFYRMRVQFFHRTARDYLLDVARRAAMHKAIGAPNMTDIFSILRLAEIVLAGKYKKAAGADPRRRRLYLNYAGSLFGLANDIDGTRYQLPRRHLERLKQDLATTGGGEAGGYVVSCFRALGDSDRIDEDPEKSASFLHWLAAQGQSEYVLESLEDTNEAYANSGLSLLLSAAFGPRRFSLGAFEVLLAKGASSATQVQLKPSFLDDPLATSFVPTRVLTAFAAAVVFRLLGKNVRRGSAKSRGTRTKEAGELWAFLRQMLAAAKAQGEQTDMFIVLDPNENSVAHDSTQGYFSTLEQVVAVYDDSTPGQLGQDMAADDAHADMPLWAESHLPGTENSWCRVTGSQLKDYCCTAVLSRTEMITIDEGLFFPLY